MIETLFLRTSGDGVKQGWLQTGPNIHALSEEELSALLADQNRVKRLVLVFPVTQCLLATLPVTRQQLKQLGATEVAYLLEDLSLTPVEQLHVVYQPIDDERLQVLAIPDLTLQELLRPFKGSDYQLVAAIPDLFLLPTHEQAWSLVMEQETCWLRYGVWQGMSLDLANASTLLQAVWQETTTEKIYAYGEIPAHVQAWLEQQPVACQVEPVLDWTQALPQLTPQHPMNVLQGEYAIKSASTLSSYWRYAAVFVALALSVQFLYDGMRLWHFNKQDKVSKNQAVQLYRQWFPEEQRVVSVRRQLEAHLTDSEHGAQGFLPLMTRVGQVLNQGKWQTQRIDYDSNGLLLEVDATSLGDLDQLKQQLTAQGLISETLGANSQGTHFRGRLRISENS